MKNFYEKWINSSLISRIFFGILIGATLAICCPNLKFISEFGNIFIGLLKAIAPIFVFILIIHSLINAKENIGKRFFKVITLYLFSTLLASAIAIIGCKLFPLSIKLTHSAESTNLPKSVESLFTKILSDASTNPIVAISNANYLSILFWAILFGLLLKDLASKETRQIITDLADITSKIVTMIIQFYPIGIIGIVFGAISQNGMSIFIDYGKLMALLVGCMIFTNWVSNPLIAFLYLRKNPFPLVFQCTKESGLTAFFTRSSAANIPVNLKLCEKMGLDKDFYSVSIPLGATINMDGAAITIAVMSLTLATTLGINVDFSSALFLCVLATFCACGASGVPGGSLLLIPMASSLFGISNDLSMQMVAVGFIIGFITDSFETALNSSGDILFTAVADYCDKQKN